MERRTALTAIAMGVTSLVTGCGGGGGGGSSPAPSAPLNPTPVNPTPTTPTNPTTPTTPTTPTNVTFGEISVHDPSVIKVGATYYVFGSHLSAAKTTDLMNWTRVADGTNEANPLFKTAAGGNVLTQLAEAFAWTKSTRNPNPTLWAADVHKLDNGKFAFYYNAAEGFSPLSAMGLATADNVEGPYLNQQIFLKSGGAGQRLADGTAYNADFHPNVVDPQAFRDKDGKMWMVYGSYSGGIFILEMDKATGLPLNSTYNQQNGGFGKRLIGNYHARIEGGYILYSPQSQYYYLFMSFGGLGAGTDGGYNMRVARSRNPDGPYVDTKGTDMTTVKGTPGKIFDDAVYAPHALKLMGAHEFALGQNLVQRYVSPGHNSAYHETANNSNQYFLVFHSRFNLGVEIHEVRVHEFFINEEGWPVVAPLRYVPLSKSATTVAAAVSAADAAGTYLMVNHGIDIAAAPKVAQNLVLNANGSVSGALTGTWAHKGSNNITITPSSGPAFSGVLSRQYNPGAQAFVVTFAAQSNDNVSIGAIRTGA
jgi:arabinan endo-1,5-alpha-L-arabinosidase